MRTIPIVSAVDAPSSMKTGEFTVSPPLALYVHVPWCVRKCPYCDFNSHEQKTGLPEAAYVDALIQDLQSALPLIWGRPVVSVFFGGGTPSLLSPQAIDTLISAFRALAMLSPEAEITLEANPGTVEAEKFAAFRQAGINRLSLGIQSFNDTHLQALGRIHGSAEARRAAQLAGEHFETFNLDLMYGLPGQTLAQACQDVEIALGFQPKHLSCYQLTLEPNTHFAAFPPDLPDGDLCADMQEAIEKRLAEAGFDNYETSAFARAHHRCKHNQNYWFFGDYLGIGAGAHSKLTRHDGIVRQMRWKHPNAYLDNAAKGQFIQENREIPANELAFEFMMNALRLSDGFPAGLFEARTAQLFAQILPTLHRAEKAGLLQISAGNIRPTLKGKRYLNQLLGYFLDQ